MNIYIIIINNKMSEEILIKIKNNLEPKNSFLNYIIESEKKRKYYTFEERLASYLCYLCQYGNYDDIKEYLEKLKNYVKAPITIKDIINTRVIEFNNGTAMHVLLYWNNDRNALNIYSLLVLHGGIAITDEDGKYPWEQKRTIMISYDTGIFCGRRNINDFTDIYNIIYNYELLR